MEKFEVFGEFKLDVSKEVEAGSHESAFQHAIETLGSENIELYELKVTTTSGEVITLKVHDMNLEWQNAFGEDE